MLLNQTKGRKEYAWPQDTGESLVLSCPILMVN